MSTTPRPRVITLCGSTRFKQEFEAENRRLTLEGHIVISVGLFGHHEPDFDWGDPKVALDELHKRKIDLADQIHVINVGGYVGDSTRGEIHYAIDHGKRVTYLEPLT
jgi:dienelactone hydrolase